MADTREASAKVFISSVIAGMEEYRAAAREAAEGLGCTVIAAEDFRASPSSPQQVCLEGVRDADVVVLLLGARYGTPRSSGLSPTHEEYRKARGTKPVLVFVETGVTPEPAEAAFIGEVSGWEGGQYRESFDTPESLRKAVTGALHRWEVNQQAGPVDEEELRTRAAALLPRRSPSSPGSPILRVVVAGAPAQQVLQPGDLDNQALQRDMEREALYGDHPVLDPTHRLSRAALACRLGGVGFLSWRTRTEVAASPNRAEMNNPSGRESADAAPVVAYEYCL